MSLFHFMTYKLGRSVYWDGEKQIIVNDPEAEKLMSRAYLAPWEYPEF